MSELHAHNGFALPAIGLGTYKLNGVAGAEAVANGIRGGYRLLDSAFNYENEGTVGRGMRDANVRRDQLIYTSKLPGRHHEYTAALRTIEESVYRAGVAAIDLYMIHWPNPITGRYVEAWEALVEARERGLVKQLGVSNFLPEHLERIETATGVRPVVNQIEMHPFYAQEEMRAYHEERGIITQAWSPVGRAGEVTEHPLINEIAASHGITAVQTILAWHVARGVVPLPKSADRGRQRENFAAAKLVLTDDEVASITSLGTPGQARLDPATYEEF
ncbi:MAG: aldo/keto reductase [Leucobacter sp.]